jgi:hypothetical protein
MHVIAIKINYILTPSFQINVLAFLDTFFLLMYLDISIYLGA